MAVRLDQFIANASDLSRKEAKKAISEGRVTIDEIQATHANEKIAANARVLLDGEPLSLPAEHYLMLHKPAGYVSATRDSEHPTAIDLLPPDLTHRQGLHIAGRLDRDTTGLLLLTTDGQWSHRITSPRHDCQKVYRVNLAHPLDSQQKHQLEQGIMLDGEEKPTRPAKVTAVAERMIELTISEGRYHQVKRMLAAVGNHVTGLHRQQVGAIRLDTRLKPGEFRALTQEETESV